MDILTIKVLRGPNFWSNTRDKLIVMKLDIGEFETRPTHLIKGFPERLKETLPSLYNHCCSEGKEGGFFSRVDDGTWLGHVIEHVALELQWLAGMHCGFGRTRSTPDEGVYHVVFSYEVEAAGKHAGHAAVALVNALATHKKHTPVSKIVDELKRIYARDGLGPSTKSLVVEAQKRNIPYTRLDEDSLIMLGQGCHQKLICATVTGLTSNLAAEHAADKNTTKQILASGYVPVPKGLIVRNYEQLSEAISELEFPWVIKPVNGNHGRGITTNINTKEKANAAFALAQNVSKKVIVERFIKGADYRFLVINYKLVAVAKRTPALVVGTGTATIQELIDLVNQDPNRGEDHEKFLTKIKVDETTRAILLEQGLLLDSVLPAGHVLALKHTANLSSGGTATDVTATVNPQNVFLAERIARLMGLDICGIDIVAKDVSIPINEKNGAVIEVNSGPGFRMHLSPDLGTPRNVAKPVIDMLFPAGEPARIPVVAVTGTNGKTTTVRLIAHFARESGLNVGFTTTEGIYINQQEIYQGDCSGPASAGVVLRDPLVNYAVLECARGGILRSGLGFDKCSISIVTNISEDHLGLNDIHTLEDMAQAKEVVPRATLDTGYSILNADDDLVYAMRKNVTCTVALFSMNAHNPRIKAHCDNNGLAAYIDNGYIVIRQGNALKTVGKIVQIPLSFAGKADCMIQNILPATLAGYVSGFSVEQLAQWLGSFYPTPENLPGRMNMYQFNDFKVMLDYGHNEGAFIHLKTFLGQVTCTKKVGVIAATGDRKPEDIRLVGHYAAQLFDEVIIRHDVDGRGRSNQELTDLILEGFLKVKGRSIDQIKVISNEQEAIQYAMAHAVPGSLISYFPEDVMAATQYLKKAHKEWNALLTSV